jgi:glycosyltransferase involved in cell wall biosynthesis
MKDITIVSLNGEDNSGGVERVVYYLKNILSEKYKVSILERKGRRKSFDKIIYPLLFSFRLLFSKKSLIISNSWQSFLYPVDFSIHHGTTAGFLLHSGIKSKKSYFLAWMEKVSAKKAKKVIAVSENCRLELEKLYDISKEKIITLNNFVDERLFYPQPMKKNDKIKILFSGRLEERKGLTRLLEIANYIETTDKFNLMIASNSYDNCRLFSNFKNTSISTCLDINAMRDFYNSGDVFYFPTKYEGFSMATLEALSCGIPVVGSSFAIPREIRMYDFVSVEDSSDYLKTLYIIEQMKNMFYKKQDEIHNQIIKDFGLEQYRIKLFNIIKS